MNDSVHASVAPFGRRFPGNALRALGRLGLMVLGVLVFTAAILAVEIVMQRARIPDIPAQLVVIAVGLGVYLGWMRWVERRVPVELAWRRLAPEGGLGFVAGAVLVSIVLGVMALAGVFTVRGLGDSYAGGMLFLALVAAALGEELVFRGWIFRTVRDIGGTWVAVGTCAVIFAAIHLASPYASTFSTIAVALFAGVLLSLAYAVTGRLWLPVGLHLGWNVAGGLLFGTRVSGVPFPFALLHTEVRGPAVLTGGAFGTDGSIITLVLCALVSVPLAMIVIRREARPR